MALRSDIPSSTYLGLNFDISLAAEGLKSEVVAHALFLDPLLLPSHPCVRLRDMLSLVRLTLRLPVHGKKKKKGMLDR